MRSTGSSQADQAVQPTHRKCPVCSACLGLNSPFHTMLWASMGGGAPVPLQRTLPVHQASERPVAEQSSRHAGSDQKQARVLLRPLRSRRTVPGGRSARCVMQSADGKAPRCEPVVRIAPGPRIIRGQEHRAGDCATVSHINFGGKESVRTLHLSLPYHELVPDPKKSHLPSGVKCDMDGNLVVHGDNLLALKALCPTHAGKIDVIFIDPPSNADNRRWIYNDKAPGARTREWLGVTVDKEDLMRHDKWCAMMWPRLRLLRNMLSETGAIFVSVTDAEQHHLRMLMDEIFGQGSFVTNIVWEKTTVPASNARHFSCNHDFVVCYAKDKGKHGWVRRLLPRSEQTDKPYRHNDHDGKGNWRSATLITRASSPAMRFPVVNPNTREEHWPPRGKGWSCSEKRMRELIAENRVHWGKDGTGGPQLKRYLTEVRPGAVPLSLWRQDVAGNVGGARRDLNSLVPEAGDAVDDPKPTKLIERILQIAGGKNATVLDSFAGSGTTAHAVAAFNQADGGTRRFVLVECEDHADSITAERIRRVPRGGRGSTPTEVDFTFLELGKPLTEKSLCTGEMPTWRNLARHLYFSATGERLPDRSGDEKSGYVGSSKLRVVYLFYQPNHEYLKHTSLTHEMANALPLAPNGKSNLVFAPNRCVEDHRLRELGIEFCRVPTEFVFS